MRECNRSSIGRASSISWLRVRVPSESFSLNFSLYILKGVLNADTIWFGDLRRCSRSNSKNDSKARIFCNRIIWDRFMQRRDDAMNIINKILYIVVAPFIFGAGYIVGRVEKTIELWKEYTK